MNVHDLIKEAKQDASLQSHINVDDLLRQSEKEHISIETILKTNMEVIRQHVYSEDKFEEYYSKLAGYKYVDDLYQLKMGHYIRWINKKKQLVKGGGIVVDTQFTDNGVLILCKGINNNAFFKIKYNETVIFQLMSQEEQTILALYDKTQSS